MMQQESASKNKKKKKKIVARYRPRNTTSYLTEHLIFKTLKIVESTNCI